MDVSRMLCRAIGVILVVFLLLSPITAARSATEDAQPDWSSDECLRIVTDPNSIYESQDQEKQVWRLLTLRQEPAAALLLIDQLSHPEEDTRWSAASRLGWFHNSQAVEGLLKALHDKSPSVRAVAAESLGRLREKTAVDALMTVAQRDRDLDTRAAAITALGQIGDARAIPMLVRTLQQKDRIGALLHIYGCIKALVLLYPHYADNERPALSYCAMVGLGNMGAEAVDPLLAVMRTNKDAGIRALAIGALGHIGDRRAVDVLVQGITDRNRLVRFAAAQALVTIPDARAIPALAKMLNSDDSRYVSVAVEALGATGDPRAAVILLEAIHTQQEYWFTYTALQALANIHDTASLSAIVSLAADTRFYSEGMVQALGAYDDPLATQALLAMLNNPDAISLRRYIALALGKPGNTAAVEPLCAQYAALQGRSDDKDDKWDGLSRSLTRMQIVRALGVIHDRRILPMLPAVTTDEVPLREQLVITWARWKLGETAEAAMLEMVKRSLSGDDLYARLEAISLCGELKDEESLALLSECLRDPLADSHTIEAANSALTKRR